MAEDTINVTFECKTCGGTILTVEDENDDASLVTCKNCGQRFGTYGEVKAKAREMAASEVHSMVKNAFKGLKGWKVR